MKLKHLIKHLIANGCYLEGDDGIHSHYKNSANGKSSYVPRHAEIPRFTCKGICKQLDIPVKDR